MTDPEGVRQLAPEDLPADFLLYPRSGPIARQSPLERRPAAGPTARVLLYNRQTADSLAQVVAWYRAQMPGAGWSYRADESEPTGAGGAARLVFTKQDGRVRMRISLLPGQPYADYMLLLDDKLPAPLAAMMASMGTLASAASRRPKQDKAAGCTIQITETIAAPEDDS